MGIVPTIAKLYDVLIPPSLNWPTLKVDMLRWWIVISILALLLLIAAVQTYHELRLQYELLKQYLANPPTGETKVAQPFRFSDSDY